VSFSLDNGRHAPRKLLRPSSLGCSGGSPRDSSPRERDRPLGRCPCGALTFRDTCSLVASGVTFLGGQKAVRAPEGLYDWFEQLIREHITDDGPRREAFACLKELRLERAALIVGVGATLEHVLRYGELRQEGEASKPTFCLISEEAMGELYLWQKRITAEIHRDRPRG
jgi:hypothetical protein